MMRLSLALLLVLTAACGGTEEGSASFAVDRHALAGLGSLTLDAFGATDVDGGVTDCEAVLASVDDLSRFVGVASLPPFNVTHADSSTVQTLERLPLGRTLFLVLGWELPDAAGALLAVGCGEVEVQAGEKATVIVGLQAP